MFKYIISTFIPLTFASEMMIGGSLDSNSCLISAGYTWCESSNECIRQWETPCKDLYDNCNDCLLRQRNGENIACPNSCDLHTIDPTIVVDPLPPVVDPFIGDGPPTPSITPIHPICPEVMCMMYCDYGNVIDENGCQICECNEEVPPPISGMDCNL